MKACNPMTGKNFICGLTTDNLQDSWIVDSGAWGRIPARLRAIFASIFLICKGFLLWRRKRYSEMKTPVPILT
jgi:hypothetical protein